MLLTIDGVDGTICYFYGLWDLVLLILYVLT